MLCLNIDFTMETGGTTKYFSPIYKQINNVMV